MKRGIVWPLTMLGLPLALAAVVLAGRGGTISPHKANAAPPGNDVATAQRVPVIVELFTSEGCSSCPPADDVLARLEKEQPVAGAEIIALGQHVDYWNRLGWNDPYSSAAFSRRQSDYSRAFGQNGVYTPQMVVDGRTEFNGSDARAARAAIAHAAQWQKASVTLARNGDAASKTGSIALQVRVANLPRLARGDSADAWLAITESGLGTDVPRGENAGRRLQHSAVVRRLERLAVTAAPPANGAAVWTAAPVVALAPQWKRANLRLVVFVQERNSRRMLGAAAMKAEG